MYLGVNYRQLGGTYYTERISELVHLSPKWKSRRRISSPGTTEQEATAVAGGLGLRTATETDTLALCAF